MAHPPTPPLLLTRRLSSFLHSSLASLQQQQPAPALQTALLITPSGKLLAYESSVAVSTLRTQCSVAASLWAIHAASSSSVSVALNHPSSARSSDPSAAAVPSAAGKPGVPAADDDDNDNDNDRDDDDSNDNDDGGQSPLYDDSMPVSIAASFDGGAVFVVRRLHCGLLFACATPPPNSASRPPTAAGYSGLTADARTSGPAPKASAAMPASVAQSSLLPQSASAGHGPPPPAIAATITTTSSPSSPAPVALPLSATSAAASTPVLIAASSRQANTASDLAGSLVPTPSIAATSTTTTAESYATASAVLDEGALDAGADAASITTTATVTTTGGGAAGGHLSSSSSVAATVAIARRQVEELARLLDKKLGALSVPEENIGVNGFR